MSVSKIWSVRISRHYRIVIS